MSNDIINKHREEFLRLKEETQKSLESGLVHLAKSQVHAIRCQMLPEHPEVLDELTYEKIGKVEFKQTRTMSITNTITVNLIDGKVEQSKEVVAYEK